MKINIPSHLTDAKLLEDAAHLAGGERENTAQLVAHLAEIDARRLHLGAGFSSLFAYCCEVLRLSEDAAYNRIETARAAKKFPLILAGLADGSLNVTTVRLLARRLTSENHGELLAAASGRTKREVEEIVARHHPQPDVPSSVRKLPTRPVLALDDLPPAMPPTPSGPCLPAGPASATLRPRASRGVSAGSRRVSAGVRRAVAARDEGRCAFVGEGGHRCNERAFLEFHHVEAYAGGGKATVGYIELRCRAHNGYEAELYFGGAWSAGNQHGPDRVRPLPEPGPSAPLST